MLKAFIFFTLWFVISLIIVMIVNTELVKRNVSLNGAFSQFISGFPGGIISVLAAMHPFPNSVVNRQAYAAGGFFGVLCSTITYVIYIW
jgi:hypothetical protein